MATLQKSRSYAHEKELEAIGTEIGYQESKRAWGSNGEALGWPKEVDVVWGKHDSLPDLTIQSKTSSSYPQWLKDAMRRSEDGPVQVWGHGLSLMPLGTLLESLRGRLEFDHPEPLERQLPKWLSGEYFGSLDQADVVVFRATGRGVRVKHYAFVPNHLYVNNFRKMRPEPRTSIQPTPAKCVCPNCGHEIS